MKHSNTTYELQEGVYNAEIHYGWPFSLNVTPTRNETQQWCCIVWCTFILCCTKFSQWLLPSQAILLLKVGILLHQAVHLCSHSVCLALTSHETQNSRFCWQTFTIINDSKKPGMRVTFLLPVFALWPRPRLQPGRQRRSWAQTDHSQWHQHKPRFCRNSSTGPCSSRGSALVVLCLNGHNAIVLVRLAFPASSLLGSVTASSLILSRDHNRSLEHSQGYS